MPLPMVHLACAYLYSAGIKKLHTSPEFYLGTISPDAIHARRDTTKSDKRITHLNTQIPPYSEKIRRLWISDSSDFAAGYGLHLICDRLWAKFYRPIRGLFDEKSGRVLPNIYYNDTDQVDILLYKNLPYTSFLMEMLNASHAHDFYIDTNIISPEADGTAELLTAGEIERWKNRVIRILETGHCSYHGEIKYLTYEKVCSFISGFAPLAENVINEFMCGSLK